jgi:hypothetical protein
MDLPQLKSMVAVSGGALRLKLDDLASASLTQSFAPYLSDDTLVINDVTQSIETADGVTVVGTGGNQIFAGMAVTALFRLDSDGEAAVFITAAGPDEWTFDKSFPVLEGTIFAALKFAPAPTLYLSSYQVSDQIGAGLSFAGVLDPTALGAYGFLTGGAEQQLTGEILMTEGVPAIVLLGPINASVDLDFLSLANVRYEVYCDPRYDSARFEWAVDAYVGFSADIKFSAQGQEHTITIMADVFEPSTSVLFVVDLGDGIDAALGELSALANGVGLSVPFDQFRIANNVKLTDLKVMVNPTGQQKISYLTLAVETVEELSLLDDLLTLQAIDVTFRIDDPLGTPNLTGVLSGLVGIGETGTLEVSADFSEYAFGGALRRSDPLSIKEVFEQFAGVGNDDLPDLNLSHFDFSLQPTAASYTGFIELEAGAWSIPLGVASLNIEDLKFSFEHPQAGEPTTVNVLGAFGIGSFQIVVEAEYEGTDKGWTFKGSTGDGQTLALGEFVQSLAQAFGVNEELPAPIADLTIQNLHVTFNTLRKDFTFTCETTLPLDGRAAQLAVSVALTSSNNGYSKIFGGTLTLGALSFDLHFSADNTSSFFLAAYTHSGDQQGINIKSLVEQMSSDLANLIPENLAIDLEDALLAFGKTADESKFLLGLDVGTSINLSNLPLVGRQFPPDASLVVDDLQLLIASTGLTRREVEALNDLAPASVTRLPEPAQDDNAEPTGGNGTPVVGSAEAAAIAKGLTVSATLSFGGLVRVLGLPVAASAETPVPPTQTTPPDIPSSGAVRWLDLQRTFGPVYFDKAGVQYQDAALWFLLNAALTGAGLTISLDGLSVGSPLNSFSPRFELRGLGIDFHGGAVEIGGAFLRTVKEGQPDQYDGTAVIRTEEATLAALGSYSELAGHPSLFIYAFLDYPLGGPAFFFVTGLAAGFGFNRKLIAPSIDNVADFPLVKQAVGAAAPPGGLSDALEALQQCIPPAAGEVFLAVGVKFNSFKLIDSFALLTVEFGGHFVANILGLSTAIIPTPEPGQSVTPLAEVQIAWKATFDPEDGFLGVQAQLTPRSYILSRDCRLTGGYAFYSWFSGEHAGDFVQTLGGYHPRFVVPAHYPVVPRLGYTWKVSDVLTIKGDAYYALTGSALMAGGHLEVLFDEGDLKAWLKLGADFLISWKPYHYDAEIYVDVGVSYTFDIKILFGHVRVTISVDVGADLHLWGPDFSGTAEIDISVISFTVSFGAGASQTPGAIDWDTFRNSFLPAEKVCSISAKDGLVRKVGEGDAERWIFNPKDFSLVINSAIPLKTARNNNKELVPDTARANFGIGSMAVAQDDLFSTMTITVKRDGAPADDEFSYAPILKKVPAGLWGESLTPDINANTFIEDVPTGVEIRPSKQPDPGITSLIDLGEFKYASSYFPKDEGYPDDAGYAYAWEPSASFAVSTGVEGRDAVRDSIGSNPLRASLLSALNVDVDVSVGGGVADDLVSAPRVGSFSA